MRTRASECACATISLFLFALTACSTAPGFDYGPFLEAMPRSILVLPPLDNSIEPEASALYLSTVTRPLAERGYYVFPVALVERMMKENGLPTAAEMHQVSLAKIDEVFGPDAVLYVTIQDWGTRYRVLDSSTIVEVEARLVDVSSGTEIWRGHQSAQRSSNQGNQGGILGALAGALVNQVVSSLADPSRDLASECNGTMIHHPGHGLLIGEFHPAYEKDHQQRVEDRAKHAQENKGS